uniref:Uncharacterized protein n=1 Tax=Tanacetum cinerariifolium TaxID=118510 RepID=A0A699HGF7_TANCI|nr:hypothetical protein [Tanacetum cinerariifolium]
MMEDASKKRRMIDDLDKDDVVDLMDDKGEEKRKKSMQEDKPAEVQKVVDVVTTTKLITKVVTAASKSVTAASTTIAAAEPQVPTATITATPIRVAAASTKRRKGVKKQQVKMDEEYARKLHEELNKDIDWNVSIDHVKQKAKEDPFVQRYQVMKKRPQTEAQARKNETYRSKLTIWNWLKRFFTIGIKSQELMMSRITRLFLCRFYEENDDDGVIKVFRSDPTRQNNNNNSCDWASDVVFVVNAASSKFVLFIKCSFNTVEDVCVTININAARNFMLLEVIKVNSLVQMKGVGAKCFVKLIVVPFSIVPFVNGFYTNVVLLWGNDLVGPTL